MKAATRNGWLSCFPTLPSPLRAGLKAGVRGWTGHRTLCGRSILRGQCCLDGPRNPRLCLLISSRPGAPTRLRSISTDNLGWRRTKGFRAVPPCKTHLHLGWTLYKVQPRYQLERTGKGTPTVMKPQPNSALLLRLLGQQHSPREACGEAGLDHADFQAWWRDQLKQRVPDQNGRCPSAVSSPRPHSPRPTRRSPHPCRIGPGPVHGLRLRHGPGPPVATGLLPSAGPRPSGRNPGCQSLSGGHRRRTDSPAKGHDCQNNRLCAHRQGTVAGHAGFGCRPIKGVCRRHQPVDGGNPRQSPHRIRAAGLRPRAVASD